MVARKGSAPPTSGCRPDVILFHHRRVEARLAETGCRGWIRTTIVAFKGRCPTVRPPGNELVEPEVVATSPYRIKSPGPVCCGFDSMKLVGERGLAPPRLADSRSAGSAIPSEPLAQISKLDPPAGAAPTGILYKRNPQAATWRRKPNSARR